MLPNFFLSWRVKRFQFWTKRVNRGVTRHRPLGCIFRVLAVAHKRFQLYIFFASPVAAARTPDVVGKTPPATIANSASFEPPRPEMTLPSALGSGCSHSRWPSPSQVRCYMAPPACDRLQPRLDLCLQVCCQDSARMSAPEDEMAGDVRARADDP